MASYAAWGDSNDSDVSSDDGASGCGVVRAFDVDGEDGVEPEGWMGPDANKRAHVGITASYTGRVGPCHGYMLRWMFLRLSAAGEVRTQGRGEDYGSCNGCDPIEDVAQPEGHIVFPRVYAAVLRSVLDEVEGWDGDITVRTLPVCPTDEALYDACVQEVQQAAPELPDSTAPRADAIVAALQELRARALYVLRLTAAHAPFTAIKAL